MITYTPWQDRINIPNKSIVVTREEFTQDHARQIVEQFELSAIDDPSFDVTKAIESTFVVTEETEEHKTKNTKGQKPDNE